MMSNLGIIIMALVVMVMVMLNNSSMCSCSSHYNLTTNKNHNKNDELVATKLRRGGLAYTVDDYGAKADGGDDSQAFKRAWNVACASKNGLLVVPGNKVYHVNPISFQGPCRSSTTVKLYGTIKAPSSTYLYHKDTMHWLIFKAVDRLTVQGGGLVDGSGQLWWTKSCKTDKRQPCRGAPTAMTFYECKNLKVADITIRNAQQMHLTFQKCENVEAMDLRVLSPAKSPNTDGIHVTRTQNITMDRCVIKTGDDCISIVTGSTNVRATDIFCGPGHGISIGSLGARNSEGRVSDVYVTRARLFDTTNGVRIKTWQGGYGYVKNVVFQDIEMKNVVHPIIIDQHYCDHSKSCREQNSSVQVSNIRYKNIRGTSASKEAVKLGCSKQLPCYKISMEDINLTTRNKRRQRAEASCSNIHRIDKKGYISPQCS